MMWKTRDGEYVHMTDMTDDHLQNAINCVNVPDLVRDRLKQEQQRREHNKVKQISLRCVWCGDGMYLEKYTDPYPDVGAVFGEEWRFVCRTCNACGPISDSLIKASQRRPISEE